MPQAVIRQACVIPIFKGHDAQHNVITKLCFQQPSLKPRFKAVANSSFPNVSEVAIWYALDATLTLCYLVRYSRSVSTMNQDLDINMYQMELFTRIVSEYYHNMLLPELSMTIQRSRQCVCRHGANYLASITSFRRGEGWLPFRSGPQVEWRTWVPLRWDILHSKNVTSRW